MMGRKYILLMIGFFSVSGSLSAQSFDRFVVSSAGSSIKNEDVQLSFTVGEAVVFSANANNLRLSAGFQKATVENVTTGIEFRSYLQDMIVYPNPVSSVLQIDIQADEEFEFSVTICDLTGNQLAILTQLYGNIGYSQQQIDLIGLIPGIYLITIESKDGIPVKVFKIKKF